MREIDAFDRSALENLELRASIGVLIQRYFHSDFARGEVMQVFGSLLFMWGGLDWFMSSQDVDVYYDWFGIYLPDAIYNYSHWIAMGIGSMLVAAGNQSK